MRPEYAMLHRHTRYDVAIGCTGYSEVLILFESGLDFYLCGKKLILGANWYFKIFSTFFFKSCRYRFNFFFISSSERERQVERSVPRQWGGEMKTSRWNLKDPQMLMRHTLSEGCKGTCCCRHMEWTTKVIKRRLRSIFSRAFMPCVAWDVGVRDVIFILGMYTRIGVHAILIIENEYFVYRALTFWSRYFCPLADKVPG